MGVKRQWGVRSRPSSASSPVNQGEVQESKGMLPDDITLKFKTTLLPLARGGLDE